MIERKFLFTDSFGNKVYSEDMVMYNSWQPGASDGWDFYSHDPIYCKVDEATELYGVAEAGYEDELIGYTIFFPQGGIDIGMKRELVKINVDRLAPADTEWTLQFKRDIGIEE